LANAFEMMRGGDGNVQPQDGHDELLGRLVESLMESAEHPPSQVEGVSDEFIEQLERVPKKNLKSDMSCPICSNPFLEGMLTHNL
jgi:tRNA (cytidine32/guanosine34-2'-O)-methyltransferase